MEREHYFTVEGPNGTVDVFEIMEPQPDSAKNRNSFEPAYEVVCKGQATRYTSEGEAITVAQELAGVSSRY